ncbi:hypothetical protein B296_00033427 [Ensete ventricosum]|uniref:Inositol polyphosphate-related phosphatase domain-containing protein n=1 Tax=Ensete ventricosum TaxID=4639 RepID=A0A426YG85_ENSVE|nr:hypothetical protein B296_00033427 [Ensete ventricosum]
MRVYDRMICFVNCHFAAHLEAVSRRNADFDHIYRTMSFSRPTTGLHGAAGFFNIICILHLFCSWSYVCSIASWSERM